MTVSGNVNLSCSFLAHSVLYSFRICVSIGFKMSFYVDFTLTFFVIFHISNHICSNSVVERSKYSSLTSASMRAIS